MTAAPDDEERTRSRRRMVLCVRLLVALTLAILSIVACLKAADDFSDYELVDAQPFLCGGPAPSLSDNSGGGHRRAWLPAGGNLTAPQEPYDTFFIENGVLWDLENNITAMVLSRENVIKASVPMYVGSAFFVVKILGSIAAFVTAWTILGLPREDGDPSVALAATDPDARACCCLACAKQQHMYRFVRGASVLLMSVALYPLSFALSWSYDQTPFSYTPVSTQPVALTQLVCGPTPPTDVTIRKGTGHFPDTLLLTLNGGNGAMGLILIFPTVCTLLCVVVLVANCLYASRLRTRRGPCHERVFFAAVALAALAAVMSVAMFVIYVVIEMSTPDLTRAFTLNLENLFVIGDVSREQLANIATTELVLGVLLWLVDVALARAARPKSEVVAPSVELV